MWNRNVGDEMMKLKCHIEKYISESGLKKGFIAKQLGISTSQLRNYEIGKSYPPSDKLFMLAKLLRVSTDELYEWIEDE